MSLQLKLKIVEETGHALEMDDWFNSSAAIADPEHPSMEKVEVVAGVLSSEFADVLEDCWRDEPCS